jgi:hypothetical protein
VAFTAAYGALGATFARRPRIFQAASALLVLGAIADELENLTLIQNIRAHAVLEDGAVQTMRLFGSAKWLLLVGGLVLLGIGWWTDRR